MPGAKAIFDRPRYRQSVLRSAADFLESVPESIHLSGGAYVHEALRFLRYVDEVARAGSIRKAAEQLHVTASAVNRRVMDLEDELGAPLFEAAPRGCGSPRRANCSCAIPRAVRDVERISPRSEDLKGLRRGTVRIGCSQALALDFLPREIRRLSGEILPAVAFDVKVFDHERAMTALSAYEVDLVLVFRPPFLANFQPLMSLRQRLVALMAADHPLAARSKIRLSDCVGHPWRSRNAASAAQLLAEVLARSNLRFDIAAESNSFEFLRGMVLRDKVIRSRSKSVRLRATNSSCARSMSRCAARGPGAWAIARAEICRCGSEVRRAAGAGAGGDAA